MAARGQPAAAAAAAAGSGGGKGGRGAGASPLDVRHGLTAPGPRALHVERRRRGGQYRRFTRISRKTPSQELARTYPNSGSLARGDHVQLGKLLHVHTDGRNQTRDETSTFDGREQDSKQKSNTKQGDSMSQISCTSNKKLWKRPVLMMIIFPSWFPESC